jgi:hypothetical protein
VILVPLIAAASLSGTAVVDRTVSCQVPVQAGVPVFTLKASPVSTFIATDGKRGFLNAGLWVDVNDHGTGDGVTLLGVANVLNGYAAPAAQWCTAAPRIPLAPSGVPREGAYRSYSSGLGEGMGARCPAATRITIRLRATILKGVAVAAQLAVRSGKKQRPLAYVDWAPKKVTTYLTDDCRS